MSNIFHPIPNIPMLPGRQPQQMMQQQNNNNNSQAQQQQQQQNTLSLNLPGASSHNLSSSPSHHPTLPWTAGIPSPPRLLVPPPAITTEVHQHARQFQRPGNVNKQLQQQQQTNGVGNVNNNNLLQKSTIMPTSLQDWRYESRREAQHILPHIYLGPLSSAKDINFLKRENITQLIAIRNSMTARARLLTAANEVNKDPELANRVKFESVDVSNNLELIHSFPIACRLIDEHLYSNCEPTMPRKTDENMPYQPPNPGKTLIYCESGNERSAAVLAAYIMQHLGVSAVQAIQIIQGRRFCVCFDDGMKFLLTSYEPIWRANKDVDDYRRMQMEAEMQQQQQQQQQQQNQHQQQLQSSSSGGKRGKRGVEEAYSDEMMDGAGGDDNWISDYARFEKREGVAPFRDLSSQDMAMD